MLPSCPVAYVKSCNQLTMSDFVFVVNRWFLLPYWSIAGLDVRQCDARAAVECDLLSISI